MPGQKQHKHAQKKRKRIRKRNKCRQPQVDETKMTSDRCTHRRSTTALLALRGVAYRVAPSRRNATTTTLLPRQVQGIPPVRRGQWGRGRSDALQEGPAAPAGVTASVMDEPPGIYPNPNNHQHPGRSEVLHQNCRPPTCATTVTEPSTPTRDLEEG